MSEEGKCSNVPPASGDVVGCYPSRAVLELTQNGIVEIQAGAQWLMANGHFYPWSDAIWNCCCFQRQQVQGWCVLLWARVVQSLCAFICQRWMQLLLWKLPAAVTRMMLEIDTFFLQAFLLKMEKVSSSFCLQESWERVQTSMLWAWKDRSVHENSPFSSLSLISKNIEIIPLLVEICWISEAYKKSHHVQILGV